MFGRKLACSFCRRTEDRVSKLVAGPRVYICDRCATEVIRIMNDSERPSPASPRASSIAVPGRLRRSWPRWFTGASDRQSVPHPLASGV